MPEKEKAMVRIPQYNPTHIHSLPPPPPSPPPPECSSASPRASPAAGSWASPARCPLRGAAAQGSANSASVMMESKVEKRNKKGGGAGGLPAAIDLEIREAEQYLATDGQESISGMDIGDPGDPVDPGAAFRSTASRGAISPVRPAAVIEQAQLSLSDQIPLRIFWKVEYSEEHTTEDDHQVFEVSSDEDRPSSPALKPALGGGRFWANALTGEDEDERASPQEHVRVIERRGFPRPGSGRAARIPSLATGSMSGQGGPLDGVPPAKAPAAKPIASQPQANSKTQQAMQPGKASGQGNRPSAQITTSSIWSYGTVRWKMSLKPSKTPDMKVAFY
ncbi:hypothetical protein ZWY2020_054313 [Hordeum vulgare]|nr:hypothetical protein ZWY2020_054313 [Hordeum vulgare]